MQENEDKDLKLSSRVSVYFCSFVIHKFVSTILSKTKKNLGGFFIFWW
jgi:hypothetical protein